MKKIIIHSFLPKYEDAVYYAYRCLNTSKEEMEEGKSIIAFTVNMERRICVTTGTKTAYDLLFGRTKYE